jgi:hypothetical protein
MLSLYGRKQRKSINVTGLRISETGLQHAGKADLFIITPVLNLQNLRMTERENIRLEILYS